MITLTEKEKKLLIECLDHVMDWEVHMDKAFVNKKVKGLFGIDMIDYVPTTRTTSLQKLKFKIKRDNA